MRVEHKQIKIAEYLGWMDIYRCGASLKRSANGEIHGKYYVGTLDKPSINYSRTYMPIPKYFHDLNAMHEAEKVIKNRDLWMFNLAEEVGVDVHWNGRSSCTEWPIHICDKIQSATAAQRAEAFGKTLNLW